MLNNLKKRKEEGFTIIEVMIVLAIAGLIILVVLLAIPALQRNSRNTTIKNDAASVAGTISEFSSTYSGAMPGYVASADGDEKVEAKDSGTGTKVVSGKVQGSTVVAEGTGTNDTDLPVGKINVALKRKCKTDGTGLEAGNAPRAAAILYKVETSNSANSPLQCLDA